MLQVMSVSDITALIKHKLEDEIPGILLRGEISECKFHNSGHVYLVLKDPGAVMPAVIWRSTARRLGVRPEVGMDVIVTGNLNVYPPHGRYQFIIRDLQDAGRGELYARFEALKKRLVEDGLCEPERKKPVPKYPLNVGIVTGETTAALQDILQVFEHSAAHVQLIFSPARVQGKGAAATVTAAMEALRPLSPDCVILARGGGSFEDLWEFNDESLARYLADYPLPVVTGIGHETDTSIADLVADHRASTPTNAAEFVCTYWKEARNTLNYLDMTLNARAENLLERKIRRLQDLKRYLSSRRIQESLAAWDYKIKAAQQRAARALHGRFERSRQYLRNLEARLSSRRFAETLRASGDQLRAYRRAMEKAAKGSIKYKKIHLQGIQGKLLAYSPEHTMKKGYVLVRDADGHLVRRAAALSADDAVAVEFYDGFAGARVTKINKKDRT